MFIFLQAYFNWKHAKEMSKIRAEERRREAADYWRRQTKRDNWLDQETITKKHDQPYTCPNCGCEWENEDAAWAGVHWSDKVEHACQTCCRGND